MYFFVKSSIGLINFKEKCVNLINETRAKSQVDQLTLLLPVIENEYQSNFVNL